MPPLWLVGARTRLRSDSLLPVVGLVSLLCSTAIAGGAAEEPSARFVDRTAELGIDFEHRHFGRSEKFMPENMGSGVAILDADGDGRLDLYFVQGAPLDAAETDETATNRLYLQRPDGTFDDVTAESGAGDRGYGMGVSYGDIDGDGDVDLHVTNFGRNTLLRNRGDGHFEDITEWAGVDDDAWSTSSGFFDADGDGDLDLYVVNYVDFSFDNHKFCGNAQAGIRSYCHPDVYDGLPDVLLINDGSGRYTDASAAAGLERGSDAKGLGLGFADLDGDGTLDIFVANDSTNNHLYLGDGAGAFEEGGLLAGVAVNGAGAAEASMGVAIDDVDGDGLPDLFLTHLDQETNTLYRNLGAGLFDDVTDAAGLGLPSLPWVGFGTVAFDHDLDGDLDLFVANGHIIDNIELFDASRSHRQPLQLFDNLGSGRFVDASAELGALQPLVGRGVAAGDLDRDGDVDLVVTENGGRPLVLVNRAGDGAASIAVRLLGRESNLQGFGARVTLRAADRTQVRLLHSTIGYLSQGAAEVYFGLGSLSGELELTVDWPSGQRDRHSGLTADALYLLRESAGEVSRESFR